jgi:hypothetical protein
METVPTYALSTEDHEGMARYTGTTVSLFVI